MTERRMRGLNPAVTTRLVRAFNALVTLVPSETSRSRPAPKTRFEELKMLGNLRPRAACHPSARRTVASLCLALSLAACGQSEKGDGPATPTIGPVGAASGVVAEARVLPVSSVALGLRSGGRVLKIAVEEGQAVKAGAELLRVVVQARLDELHREVAAGLATRQVQFRLGVKHALFDDDRERHMRQSQGDFLQVPLGTRGQIRRFAAEFMIVENEVGRFGVGLLGFPEGVGVLPHRERSIERRSRLRSAPATQATAMIGAAVVVAGGAAA